MKYSLYGNSRSSKSNQMIYHCVSPLATYSKNVNNFIAQNFRDGQKKIFRTMRATTRSRILRRITSMAPRENGRTEKVPLATFCGRVMTFRYRLFLPFVFFPSLSNFFYTISKSTSLSLARCCSRICK